MADRVHVLTSDEVAGIFSKLNSVKDGIKKLTEQSVRTRQFLTDTELSHELKISKKTLANYRAKGEFGYYALPGKILYDATEIDDFMQKAIICRLSAERQSPRPTTMMAGAIFIITVGYFCEPNLAASEPICSAMDLSTTFA